MTESGEQGRRVLTPLNIARAASGFAVLLAVPGIFGPSYDAGVAVLTATLIAIIWYTYFTHGLVRSAQQQANLVKTQLDMLLDAAGRQTYADHAAVVAVLGPASRMLKELESWRDIMTNTPLRHGPNIDARKGSSKYTRLFPQLREAVKSSPGPIRVVGERAVSDIDAMKSTSGLKHAITSTAALVQACNEQLSERLSDETRARLLERE